jgi:hypothetical protein
MKMIGWLGIGVVALSGWLLVSLVVHGGAAAPSNSQQLSRARIESDPSYTPAPVPVSGLVATQATIIGPNVRTSVQIVP